MLGESIVSVGSHLFTVFAIQATSLECTHYFFLFDFVL